MPTIDQLPAATAAADTDELVVSQSGITRKLTRAQLVAGLQTVFTAGAGQLLGNSSGGGGTEGITVGANLILANATLSATSTPFVITGLPAGVTPASADIVALSQNGTSVAVSYNQFMSGLSALSSVNASHFNVTPTGSTSVLQLGQFAANTIQKSGAQMSGPLLLASDPTLPLQAATMEYVQNTVTAATAGFIGNAGGTLTGMLSAQGGLDVSVTRNWSGGTNSNDSNPSQGGIGGVQRFYGTVAATTQSYGGTPLNELLILDSLNAGLAGGADGFNVSMISSGTACLGARTALQSTLTMSCPTGNTGGEYSGFEAYCIASGNDNGTAANASGGIFGINTVAQLAGSCTYWGSCVGYELDISVAAGANVETVFGLHVCTLSPHAVNGSLDDIAMHISGSGGSAYWNTGLGFGANTKPKAFGPNSTLIKVYPDVLAPTAPLTVKNGIDFTMLAPTGFVVASPGYTLGNVGQTAQTITNPGPSSLATVPSQITFSPTADRGAGGYTGMSAQVIAGTISQNPDNTGSRFNTEFESVQLTIQSTSGANSIGHSAVGTHVTKLLPVQSNGTVYNMGSSDTLPACWSLYGTAVDQSNLPTSKSGPLACQEYDMQVNAIDDQGVRGGYAFNADTKLPLSSNGIPGTVSQGFYSFGLNDTWIWCAHRTAGNHIMAAHDCRAITGPETSVSVASTGTTVAVANVTPYTIGSNDGGTGLNLAGAKNPIYNVKIGSNTYQVSAATQDGPGKRSGVLTLSSALQGTDGAAGNTVARPFYALIMRTGDRIGFDVNGNVQMFYDSGIFGGGGGLHLTANVQCNAFQANTVIATAGTSTFSNVAVTSLSASGGVNVTGGTLQPPSFTFAGLPSASSAPANGIIWVSNGLKPGEASGAGSGVLACRNGAGTAWLRVGDYTAVAA